MNIIAVGINHKTSSIDIREKFYLQPLERELLLSGFKADARVAEAMIISTCNRTEIYANVIGNDDGRFLMEAIFTLKKVAQSQQMEKHFYLLKAGAAVEHLLRVAAGLDSLILGEKQILGQLKEAIEFSRQRGMMAKAFNILSQLALETGKKVRHTTPIGSGGSSVSWAAVMISADILGSLQGRSVLILGSGKMGRIAVEQLGNKGVDKIYIMNRTMEKAQELALASNGVAVHFWDLKEMLKKVDLCICSSSCVHHLISRELVEEVMGAREDRPLVCVDISMPRNIAPEVGRVVNVSLVTIDDLDKVVGESLQKRLSAVSTVEAIIENKIAEFDRTMVKRSRQSMQENLIGG